MGTCKELKTCVSEWEVTSPKSVLRCGFGLYLIPLESFHGTEVPFVTADPLYEEEKNSSVLAQRNSRSNNSPTETRRVLRTSSPAAVSTVHALSPHWSTTNYNRQINFFTGLVVGCCVFIGLSPFSMARVVELLIHALKVFHGYPVDHWRQNQIVSKDRTH